MDRSSGVVMKPRTSSALAPTYVVVTVMAAFSLRGYWRTLSERIACTPAITMIKLTTIARTGRRMNRSVSFMDGPLGGSLVDGLGGQLGAGREVVPHHHRGAVAQLEGAAADDGLAGGQPGDRGDQVSAALAQPHELLPGDQRGLAAWILLLLQGEDRVTVGRVDHRGGRDHQHRPLLRRDHVHVGEHSRPQPAVRVGYGGADAHVARGHVDLG